MTGEYDRRVPDDLAQMIAERFEAYAQAQAAEHRKAGLTTYRDAQWNRSATWVMPSDHSDLEAKLVAAGVELTPGWTLPDLIGLGSLNDRVDEILSVVLN